jgi:hypothetical protein
MFSRLQWPLKDMELSLCATREALFRMSVSELDRVTMARILEAGFRFQPVFMRLAGQQSAAMAAKTLKHPHPGFVILLSGCSTYRGL